MKYLVIGAGGVGGSTAAYMHKAGLDVTVALRKKRYEDIKKSGLCFTDNTSEVLRIKATPVSKTADDYDVVIIAVKDYDLRAVCENAEGKFGTSTIVIPLMNGLTGGELAATVFKNNTVVDSCVYLTAYKNDDGGIVKTDGGFKLILEKINDERIAVIASDLERCGMKIKVSSDIKLDKFLKFFFISPLSICQACFGANCGAICSDRKMMQMFTALTEELFACGAASGIELPENCVAKNLERLEKMPVNYYSSMAKDYLHGKRYERKIMLEDVVEMAAKYGLDVPNYRKALRELKIY